MEAFYYILAYFLHLTEKNGKFYANYSRVPKKRLKCQMNFGMKY